MITEYRFQQREEMYVALSEFCAARLRMSVEQHYRASLMVSGGSTPAPLYQLLAETDLPWQRIDVGLVDERWVETDSEASNEKLIRQHLLQHLAKSANFIGMKNGADSAAEGLAECEKQYREVTPPYSLTLLGMGNDGHTASLFPNADGLYEAMEPGNPRCCAALKAEQSEVTGPYTERVSLTLAALLRSRHICLVLCGEEKWQTYRQAMAQGPVEEMPIRGLLRQSKAPIDLYWAP